VPEDLEISAAPGFVEPAVRSEFPGLRLDWVSVECRRRDSPREIQRRLKDLSGRYRGASVVAMRTQPIPHAYRAFFRQIGLDPDVDRVPSEAAAVARLLQGAFRSVNLVEDALLLGLVETGVPVWALDADRVDAGGLGIRLSAPGDRLGATEYPSAIAPGTLLVADAVSIHGMLFGEIAAGHEVTRQSSRIVLFSVGVDGVPAIHVEEALWVCLEVLNAG
jgi:DNA/RNA-binding domain of Phe-tRNA-synthetase-like protein